MVHIVLAGNPDKSWEDILPELQAANLSPASIDAIASHIKSPPSLKTLLEQINSDFAVPLLAQCQKIAHLDGNTVQLTLKTLNCVGWVEERRPERECVSKSWGFPQGNPTFPGLCWVALCLTQPTIFLNPSVLI
ncbi:hypothetical protein [Nostoc sp. XA010]|uniref:hypothetical protein n=1 Tax=Nostoc sp. XA010 TaxID=2780407 RepID=UPI0035A8AFD3